MDLSYKLLNLLHGLLVQIPSTLAIIGCIVAALIRWKRHPKVSLTVVIALVLLLLHAFVFAFVYAFVPEWLSTPGDFSRRETIFTLISFSYNFLLAIALAVLMAAIFMQRDAPLAEYSGGAETPA